jgi:hypothetical protein
MAIGNTGWTMMEGCNGAEGGGDIGKEEEEEGRRATDTDMWTAAAARWKCGDGSVVRPFGHCPRPGTVRASSLAQKKGTGKKRER